jgi:regulatory protein YycI of two-component signal transduction system YycFG
MNWKKLKKLIIPLIIVKLIILVFFIVQGNTISISRDTNYSSNYQEGFDNDSVVLKKQKLIRIVRNEEEHGISIILRGRKNARPAREKEREMNAPLVD